MFFGLYDSSIRNSFTFAVFIISTYTLKSFIKLHFISANRSASKESAPSKNPVWRTSFLCCVGYRIPLNTKYIMHFLVLFCFRIFKVKKLASCYHNSHISITTACTGFSNTRPVYTTRFVGAMFTDIQRKGQNEICCNATEFKKSGRSLCLRLKIWLTIAWITLFIHRGRLQEVY